MNMIVSTTDASEPTKIRKPRRANNSRTLVVKDDASYSLRKAPEALSIRNISSDEITFLVRKAYNAMLHVAQAEISKSGNPDQITFECSLRDFETLVGHSTPNSREHLKRVLRQLKTFNVEFDYRGEGKGRKGTWGVASMVSEVYIMEETSTISWSFPPRLQKKMLDPSIYNLLDLRVQNQFTSHSALVLYEIVSRYFTAPAKPYRRTVTEHWTTWSMILSGSKDPHKTFRDFNKMLSRALEQIKNQDKRFNIAVKITKRERKFDELWFEIEDCPQGELMLIAIAPIVASELNSVLSKFGFNEKEITELIVNHNEEYLLAQADYTEKRKNKKGADPVANPKAFFLMAIEKNYADAPRNPAIQKIDPIEKPRKRVEKAVPERDSTDQMLETLKMAWKAKKISEIKSSFHSQSEEKKQEILGDLEVEIRNKGTVIWEMYRKKGVKTATIESTVFEIIFNKTVPTPSAEDLLRFAVENNAV
jgi:hypothetical protein